MSEIRRMYDREGKLESGRPVTIKSMAYNVKHRLVLLELTDLNGEDIRYWFPFDQVRHIRASLDDVAARFPGIFDPNPKEENP